MCTLPDVLSASLNKNISFLPSRQIHIRYKDKSSYIYMIARAFIIKILALTTLYESSLGRLLQVTLESALIYDCSQSLKLVTAVAARDYTQDYDNKSKIVIFRTGEQLMVISFKDIFFFCDNYSHLEGMKE